MQLQVKIYNSITAYPSTYYQLFRYGETLNSIKVWERSSLSDTFGSKFSWVSLDTSFFCNVIYFEREKKL